MRGEGIIDVVRWRHDGYGGVVGIDEVGCDAGDCGSRAGGGEWGGGVGVVREGVSAGVLGVAACAWSFGVVFGREEARVGIGMLVLVEWFWRVGGAFGARSSWYGEPDEFCANASCEAVEEVGDTEAEVDVVHDVGAEGGDGGVEEGDGG